MVVRSTLPALLSILASLVFADDNIVVTCGSSTKLVNSGTKFNLHSHGINWGAGSGQQSVTAHSAADDQGGLWLVKESFNAIPCEAGDPIKCGDIIRLEHVRTEKNLHTHGFNAPISQQRRHEVSAFGDGGEGDGGDNWRLICLDSAKFWTRGGKIRLQSTATGRYLYSGNDVRFTQQNCPNCPIINQLEVSGDPAPNENTIWQTGQGLFLAHEGWDS